MSGHDFVTPKQPHPLLASLPTHLKDPANYEKIQKFIIETLASKHSHSDIMEWAGCGSCQRRFAERGNAIKKLGFKSPAQYALWKRVHEMIRTTKRDKLKKYDE